MPPPPEYLCGLTQELMTEPMRTKNGLHFQKVAIEEWMALGNDFCPITGNPLTIDDLVLNKSLQWSISKWRSKTEDILKAESINDVGSSSCSSDVTSLPRHFLCPLTQELMDEPVISNDGVTYERAAILKWLKEHDTCPVTQRPLSRSSLIPNTELRRALDLWQMESSMSSLSLKSPIKPKYSSAYMKQSQSAMTVTRCIPSSILQGIPTSRRKPDQVDRFKKRYAKADLIAALDEAIACSSEGM
jgi:hypothetical protein